MHKYFFPHQLLSENTSFIIEKGPENSSKLRFLLPKPTQITSSKDFSLLIKKFSRKICSLQFDPDPPLRHDNLLNRLDVYELKVFLQPCSPREDSRKKLRSFLKSLENFKKLPNLSKLYLDLSFDVSQYPMFVERLCESLKRLTHLTHLSLKIWSNDLTEYKILIFMSSLKCFKSLRFFELCLPPTEKLNTRGINELCKSLECLQKLRGLSLDLSDCPYLNDNHIEKLFESIKTLRNLSSLSLSLRNLPDLKISGVYTLLSFLNSGQEPDAREDYQIIFAKYLEASPLKLSKLRLDLSFLDKTPKGFSTNLTPYRGLTALDLDLAANINLHAGKLMEICFCLGYLKHLSRLSLNLSSNPKVGDEAIICLARAIRTLRLIEFNFRILECRSVIPSSLITLFQVIGASVGMRKLTLCFSLLFGIDKPVLRQLGLCIKGMESLDFLSLEFSNCYLDDDCLGEISGFLKNAKNLQSLKLGLDNNPSLTCEGFEKIYLVLNEARNLRRLSLSLNSECFAKKQRKLWSWSIEVLKLQVGGWDEIQFQAFCKNLGELSRLKLLDLRISHGSNISPQAIMNFLETIRKIKTLKSSDCVGYIHTFYELNGQFYPITWEMKKILSESNEDIAMKYEERVNSLQPRNKKKWWSFTLCGVKIW